MSLATTLVQAIAALALSMALASHAWSSWMMSRGREPVPAGRVDERRRKLLRPLWVLTLLMAASVVAGLLYGVSMGLPGFWQLGDAVGLEERAHVLLSLAAALLSVQLLVATTIVTQRTLHVSSLVHRRQPIGEAMVALVAGIGAGAALLLVVVAAMTTYVQIGVLGG